MQREGEAGVGVGLEDNEEGKEGRAELERERGGAEEVEL